MSRKVIDLSVWNSGSTINWKTLKENIDGVILRIGYRGYGNSGTLKTDPKFKEYAKNCVKYNIPFGVYWFAQEINEKESKETAQYIANILKDYKLSYPVYYDVEYSGAKNNTGRADVLNKDRRTKCIIAFCKEIQKYGYESGVYANDEWFAKMLDYNKIKKYSIWCAKWNSDSGKPENPPKLQYDIWQYTSKGKVSGISGCVDISLDLSALINDNTNEKSIRDIALEVISGKWGNGSKRKEALTSLGYDYYLIQDTVNAILSKK
jgi:GH25 family lysozyme M1 (1,4-beta-N-acetylmuramidase)